MEKYNGYKNYETWNVALWLGSDEGLYRIASECARRSFGYTQAAYVLAEVAGFTETPDGVRLDDPCLDINHLNEVISDFA